MVSSQLSVVSCLSHFPGCSSFTYLLGWGSEAKIPKKQAQVVKFNISEQLCC